MKSIRIFLSALLLCVAQFAGAQTSVLFPLAQMTGTTNDTTITVKTVNNPVTWRSQIYWLPTAGIQLKTLNGSATTNLIPNDYNVAITGVPGSWKISVSDTNVTLNAAEIGNLTTYAFTQPLPGVTKLIAGTGATISPSSGLGTVTIGLQGNGSGIGLSDATNAINGSGGVIATNGSSTTFKFTTSGTNAISAIAQAMGDSRYDPIDSALAVQANLNSVSNYVAGVSNNVTVATNSLYATLNAKKVNAISGVASNLFIGGDASSFNKPDDAALKIVLTNANPNGMSISMTASTNEVTAAGIHIQTPNTNYNGAQALDFGLWSPGFGPDYSGSAVIDLYNTNAGASSATSNLPPNFVVNVTDARDGGVVTHPIFGVNGTNLNFELYYKTNGSRTKIPGFVWDGTLGLKSFRQVPSTNLAPSGTVSSSGRTITGSGTLFGNSTLSEMGFGDELNVGVGVYPIKSASSATSATSSEPLGAFFGSGYGIYRAAVRWYAIDGVTPVAAIGADGTLMVKRAGDGAWLRLIGNTKDYQLAEGGSGEFLIHNSSDNSNPFLMTPGGNLTLGGSLTEAIGDGANTNILAEDINGKHFALTIGSGLNYNATTKTLSAPTGGGGDVVAANNLSEYTSSQVAARANIGALSRTNGVAGDLIVTNTLTITNGSVVDLWLSNGQHLRTNTIAPFDWWFYNTNGTVTFGTNNVTKYTLAKNGDLTLPTSNGGTIIAQTGNFSQAIFGAGLAFEVDIGGNVTGTSFTGSGSGLTLLTAANLSGIIPHGALPPFVWTNNWQNTLTNGGALTNIGPASFGNNTTNFGNAYFKGSMNGSAAGLTNYADTNIFVSTNNWAWPGPTNSVDYARGTWQRWHPIDTTPVNLTNVLNFPANQPQAVRLDIENTNTTALSVRMPPTCEATNSLGGLTVSVNASNRLCILISVEPAMAGAPGSTNVMFSDQQLLK